MAQLIIKDMLLQRKRLIYFTLFYNVFAILILQDFFLPYLVAGIVVPYIMLQTALAYEEMNKSEIVINSLPVRKEKIILARYLTIFIYLLISILCYSILTFLMNLFNLPLAGEPVSLAGIVVIFVGIGIIVSIYLPIFFRYGYIKGRVFHTVFTVAALILPTVAVKIIGENPELPGRFVVEDLVGVRTGIILLLLTLLILTISFNLSVWFYKKREF